MKKKQTRLLIIMVLMLMLCLTCDNSVKSTTEKNMEKITATWYQNVETFGFELTSSIDQKLVDLVNEGIGEITVSGDYNFSLTYLNAILDSIMIYSYFEELDGDFYKFTTSVFENSIECEVTFSDYTTETYRSESANYNLDATIMQITLDPCKLYKQIEDTIDSTSFIILEGELANEVYNVKTGEPTMVSLFRYSNDEILNPDKLIFGEDDEWKRKIYYSYSGTTEFYSGEWQLKKDSLIVYEVNDSTNIADTIRCSFDVSNDGLELYQDEAIVSEELELFNMLFQMFYNAEENSITDATIYATYGYTPDQVISSLDKKQVFTECSPFKQFLLENFNSSKLHFLKY